MQLDALRVRGFPFHDEVVDFIAAHDQVFVVEQNRDAQLRTLLINEGEIDPARLVPVLHYDGTPITARFIAERDRRAPRRAQRRRRCARPCHDLSSPSPSCITRAADQRARLHPPRLRGLGLDPVRRLRPRLRSRAAIIQACFELRPAAAPHRQALRHRLLVEDADLFPRQLARLQHACTAACRRC